MERGNRSFGRARGHRTTYLISCFPSLHGPVFHKRETRSCSKNSSLMVTPSRDTAWHRSSMSGFAGWRIVPRVVPGRTRCAKSPVARFTFSACRLVTASTSPVSRLQPKLSVRAVPGHAELQPVPCALLAFRRLDVPAPMTSLAREVGMSRVGLKRALSGEGNPNLATVLKVAKALGLKVAFQPQSANGTAGA